MFFVYQRKRRFCTDMVNINFVTTCGACLKVVENILYNGPTTIAMTCKRMDIEQTG